MRLPPPGDQEEFYEALLKHSRTAPERAVIMLLWRTGMHASTLCSGAYRLHGQASTGFIVDWRRPKTFKHLTANMRRSEARAVKHCLNAGTLPTTVRTLERWVQRVGERAGYTGICPLTLRHSRAIYLLDSGIPIHRVASLLGCSYEVLEKHYAQIEAARLVL